MSDMVDAGTAMSGTNASSPGGDHHHPDVVLLDLLPQPLGQRPDRVFRRTVNRACGNGDVAIDRGHVGQRGGHTVKRALKVHVDHLVPLNDLLRLDRRQRHQARVVEQPSIRPKLSTAALTSACMSASRVTSVSTAMASPPAALMSATIASKRSLRRGAWPSGSGNFDVQGWISRRLRSARRSCPGVSGRRTRRRTVPAAPTRESPRKVR